MRIILAPLLLCACASEPVLYGVYEGVLDEMRAELVLDDNGVAWLVEKGLNNRGGGGFEMQQLHWERHREEGALSVILSFHPAEKRNAIVLTAWTSHRALMLQNETGSVCLVPVRRAR